LLVIAKPQIQWQEHQQRQEHPFSAVVVCLCGWLSMAATPTTAGTPFLRRCCVFVWMILNGGNTNNQQVRVKAL